MKSGSSLGGRADRSSRINRRAAISVGVSITAALVTGCAPRLLGTLAPTVWADASSAEATHGVWSLLAASSATPNSVARKVQLTFRYSAKSLDGSVFSLDDGPLRSRAPETIGRTPFKYQFIRLQVSNAGASFSREPGTLMLFGFDRRRTTGNVLFVANPGFVSGLRANGVALSQREALVLSLSGTTAQDVGLVRSAFPDAEIVTMALLGISGQTGQSAVDLKQLLPAMTSTDLKHLLLRNITPSYVHDLRLSGMKRLTASDVDRLRDAGVDGAFVRSNTHDGVVPSVPQLLQAKRNPRLLG
jgi:hypothetical protein